MKIIIILICGGCVVLLGNNYSKYYKKRVLFYYELNQFCQVLENDIKFNQNSINLIIDNALKQFKSELNISLQHYFKNAKEFQKINFLSEKENETLLQFYESLGKRDVEGELGNIKNYQIDFNLQKENCESDYKKMGLLGNKLGMLSALLIFIIFI